MRILLADDHVVVRRGLRDMLANSFPGAHFIEAGTGDEVLGHIRRQACNLLILDVNMPGRSGVDVLKEVKNLNPNIPVLMLSVQPEDQYAVRCLKAGASGYLCKDSAEEELVKAARKVMEGGRYVSAQLSEKLAREIQLPSTKEPHQLLSDRELEVMRMIASGKSLTDIAEILHVSVKTVSTYRSRCLLKMQMQSNADLVRYALEHKLLA
jgi:two-component system, NarL family, invasion response regulator UvrY